MAGITVGKVSLRVMPDLKGFREKVEAEIRKIGDVEVDVNPDMNGFRQKVKSATKGMDATVDVHADTKRLIAETEAALKALKNRNFNIGKMHMDAVFREESADRRIKQFLKKADATAVIKLVVPEMKISEVSKITDRIEKQVSRDPVKIRFAAQKAQLNKVVSDVRESIQKFGPGTKRYIQLSLSPHPKDSGSQRKMQAFLDQVKAKVDKLKKPIASPWEQWDGKGALKDYNTDLAQLNKDLGKLRKMDTSSFMIGQVGIRREKESLPKHTRQLYDLIQAHKALVKSSQESGNAFPVGYRQLTRDINDLSRKLGGLKKDFGDINPEIRRQAQEMENLVRKRTRKAIYTDKIFGAENVKAAQAQLVKFRKAYEDTAAGVRKSTEKIQESVQKIREQSKNLPTKAYEKIPFQLRRQVELLKKSKKMQVKEPESLTLIKRLNALKERANETIRVRTSETIKAVKATRQLQKSSKNTGFGGKRRRGLKTIDEVGTQRFAGLSRIGWIMAAIGSVAAPVVQAVSGLVAALPALGGAALAALGVTLLGLDGIKEAATAAEPALNRAKEAVSGVFQTRLTPQFEQLGGLLDRITPQLTQVAEGMSDFSQGLVDGLTSNVGETNIQKLLGNTADLFSKMKPFAQDFTEGLLEMAGAGSETFPALAAGMNRFGASFKQNISELSQSGQLQSAIQATYDVVGSLGTNLGRIIRSGIETAPDMAKSLVPLFDGLGDGVVGLMPLLSSFSVMVGSTLGTALSSIGDMATAITPSMTKVFEDLTPGLQSVVGGLGDLAAATMPNFAALFEGLSPGAGAILQNIGDSLSEAAGVIAQHGPEIVDNLRQLGTGISDALGGLSGEGFLGSGKPLISESDMELITRITGFFADIPKLNGFGHEARLSATEIEEGFAAYGSAWSRGVIELNKDYPTLVRAAAQQVEGADTIRGSVQNMVSNIKEAAVMAEGALKIDLSPQIKQLDTATTVAEVRAAQDAISEAIRSGTAESTKVEPEITVEPKLNMAGAIDTLQASATGPIADLEATIAQFKVNAEAVASELQIDITPQIRILQEATDSTSASEAMRGVLDQITAATQMSPEQMEVQVDPSIQMGEAIDMHGQVDAALAPLKENLNAQISTLGDGIDASGAVASIGDSIGSALGGVDIPVDGLASNLSSALTGALSGLQADISGQLDGVVSAVTEAGATASEGFSSAMTEMASTSSGIVSGMAGTIRSSLNMNMYASGMVIGSTFAAGLAASVPLVQAAAGAIASAARGVFPNSPAKEGPFSGKGWVDRSGIAVGQAFADGMKSQVGVVNAAATQVANAAHREFDNFQLDPFGNMEALKRDQVLQPVLEANAKKIADWRKREEERQEKHNERLADIDANKSKGDKKEEQRAKANENLAKQSAESYEKLLESLETPDYRDIDRSFKAYWLDGISETIKDRFTNIAKDTGLLETTKTVAKNSVAEIRKAFGDSPILSQIEFNINAEHFDYTVQQAIEEANLHEIPINFVISNLDQLKSDLGMSDGVVSRAMDAAMNYNPANDDVYRYDKNKPEIHYHVTDMEEAIRLEQQRERKELLKMTN